MRRDKEKLGLRGSVKHVVVETAQLEDQNGQIVEKPSFGYTYAFNRDGQLIEEGNRNPDGSEYRVVYHYSDSGNLVARTGFDATGAVNGEVRYVYDANDKLAAEENVTLDGKVTTPTTYVYDDAGGKVKIQELDAPGENIMVGIEGTATYINTTEATRIETRYNERDEAVEVKTFKMDGSLISRMEIIRDARGNSLQETQYVENVFPLGACASDSCSTEDVAELTEERKAELAAEIARVFPPGTPFATHTHSYDEAGRLIESKLTMMGMDVSGRRFVYDEAGNKSEELSYSGASTSKSIFTREYDEHGNWTSELVSNASSWDAEFGLSTPAHVTRRVITYW